MNTYNCTNELCIKVFNYAKKYANDREIVAFSSDDEGNLLSQTIDCICALRGYEYRWVFKNIDDMKKFIHNHEESAKNCACNANHDQPERSKREDFICNHKCEWIHLAHGWKDGCTDPNTRGECTMKMRCSEHCGNTMREAQ